MAKEWTRQIRIYLSEDFAKAARKDLNSKEIKPLMDALKKHNATIKCQFDAFAGYVEEAENAISKVAGTDLEAKTRETYFLYQWTKDTIENPTKKAKYLKEYTIYVDGAATYDADVANKIESDIQSLVDGVNITGLRNRDSNPKNNPQMPKRYIKAPKQ